MNSTTTELHDQLNRLQHDRDLCTDFIGLARAVAFVFEGTDALGKKARDVLAKLEQTKEGPPTDH